VPTPLAMNGLTMPADFPTAAFERIENSALHDSGGATRRGFQACRRVAISGYDLQIFIQIPMPSVAVHAINIGQRLRVAK
jgi:hypothetical protein